MNNFLFTIVIYHLAFFMPGSLQAMEEDDRPVIRKENKVSEDTDEALTNAIKTNTHVSRNGYVFGFDLTNIPLVVANNIITDLKQQFLTRTPDQDAGEVSLKHNGYLYTGTVSFERVFQALTSNSPPKKSKAPRGLVLSLLSESKNPKKDVEDLGQEFKYFRDVVSFCTLKSTQGIEKVIHIIDLPKDSQLSLLNQIKDLILTRNYLEEDFTVDFKKDDLTYNCKVPVLLTSYYKKKNLLGPLKEVYELESKAKSRAMKEERDILLGDSASGLGNLVFHPNLLTKILDESIESGMSVLEIGSARGIDTFKMLTKGAKVTAIDLSENDLNTLKANTPDKLKGNLRTIAAKFPEELSPEVLSPDKKFDVIYMSHVAHYLTGQELRSGMEMISSLLRDHSGRFYFQALTPYSAPYAWNMMDADQALQTSYANADKGVKEAKNEWPGYFSEQDKRQAHKKRPKAVSLFRGEKMPDYGHPIHPKIIERELLRQGFTITYIGYYGLSPLISQKLNPLTYEEQEAYVKRHVNGIDPELKKTIENKLATFENNAEKTIKTRKDIPLEDYSWRDWLNIDAKTYLLNSLDKETSPAQPLVTMDGVIVIACKNCKPDEDSPEKEAETP